MEGDGVPSMGVRAGGSCPFGHVEFAVPQGPSGWNHPLEGGGEQEGREGEQRLPSSTGGHLHQSDR